MRTLGTRTLTVAAALLAGAGGLAAAAPSAGAATVITVSKSGGQYSTVQAAVNAVPSNSSTSYVIQIGAGTYHEQVVIPSGKLHLELLGATGNAADVVISDNLYAGESNGSGGTLGDIGASTVVAGPSNFTAEYITFANTFDRLNNPSATGTQDVALTMGGDRQVYKYDVFYGHQDTLLSWPSSPTATARQYVYDSTVEGDVDFIFGDGTLVIDRSTIDVLADGVYTSGYLAAPATDSAHTYGILITGSTVTSGLGSGTVDLGRAWIAYSGAVPQEVIRNTSLPAAIATSNPWIGISGSTWTSGRYGEYENSGAGATVNSHRPQLSSSTAASYTAQKYLAGTDAWNPVV